MKRNLWNGIRIFFARQDEICCYETETEYARAGIYQSQHAAR